VIDTHIHLSSTNYYTNPEKVINSLQEHNVKCVINVATDINTSQTAIALSQKFQGLSYATVGIHPEEINSDINSQTIEKLKNLLTEKSVVAVGEVGLDKTYIKDLPEKQFTERFNWQKNWLDVQVKLANAHNLPIILHSRETTEDMLEQIKGFGSNVKFVWHCFTENLETSKKVINYGGYISFTGIITYKSASDLGSVIKYIPSDRYMIETDGPFLTPEPLRKQGVKLNMPWNIYYIAEKIADVRGESVENVIKQTTLNAYTFFKI